MMGDAETEDEMHSDMCACGHEMEEHTNSDAHHEDFIGACWFADEDDVFCACIKYRPVSP